LQNSHTRSAAHARLKGLPRAVEVPLACAVLGAIAPILLVCAAAVRASSPGPAIFRQQRMGKDGRPFTMFKFRSMRQVAGPSVTVSGDSRVTRIGQFLRKTKLDELPTIWNVVRGEMRLVGPRPEVPDLVDPLDPLWAGVLRITPGITEPVTAALRDEEALLAAAGPDWQSYYRHTLQPFKLRRYLAYEQRRTWRTDLRVLLGTVVAILKTRPPADVEHALTGLLEEK
jgi:lipopolysaccharide/colanic/teichoic acid biosynthesis glycosyltransferase